MNLCQETRFGSALTQNIIKAGRFNHYFINDSTIMRLHMAYINDIRHTKITWYIMTFITHIFILFQWLDAICIHNHTVFLVTYDTYAIARDELAYTIIVLNFLSSIRIKTIPPAWPIIALKVSNTMALAVLCGKVSIYIYKKKEGISKKDVRFLKYR